MSADKHRQPGDADKHLSTWRVDSVDAESTTTERGTITDELTVRGTTVDVSPTNQSLAVGLRDSLEGWWTFESIDNGYIRDQTANENDIELFGSPSTEPGLTSDTALTFDGSDDEGRIPADASLDLTGDFTLACWMYFDSRQSWQPILTCWPDSFGGSNLHYGMWVVNASTYSEADYPMSLMGAYVDTGGTAYRVAANRMLGSGPWYHCVVTYDSEYDRLTTYVNNIAEETDTFGASPQTGEEPVQIGARGGTLLTGGIDDLRIWSRLLSREEIAAEYARGVGDKRRFQGDFLQFVDDSDGVGDTYLNAIGRYDSSKANPWRVLATNQSNSNIDLWTSSDRETWSVASADVISGYASADNVDFGAWVQDDSGTYWVYGNESGDTVVFSGSDWSTLTHDSTALAGKTDTGAIIGDDGNTYLIVEIDQVGVSAQTLEIHRASSPNGSFSKVGEALDMTDKPWNGGDPGLIKRDGVYWLFSDMTNTQEYDQAVARSEDLINWEFVSEGVLRGVGGDIDVFDGPNGELYGVTELTGGQESYGTGIWRLYDRYTVW